jgi:hypothetical protein
MMQTKRDFFKVMFIIISICKIFNVNAIFFAVIVYIYMFCKIEKDNVV